SSGGGGAAPRTPAHSRRKIVNLRPIQRQFILSPPGSPARSRHGGRRRGWSVLAVLRADAFPHLLYRLTFVDHLQHVTRDADADVSSETHAVESEIPGLGIRFQVAGSIARVALFTASAVARNVAERVLVHDGEAVSLAHVRRRAQNIGREN